MNHATDIPLSVLCYWIHVTAMFCYMHLNLFFVSSSFPWSAKLFKLCTRMKHMNDDQHFFFQTFLKSIQPQNTHAYMNNNNNQIHMPKCQKLCLRNPIVLEILLHKVNNLLIREKPMLLDNQLTAFLWHVVRVSTCSKRSCRICSEYAP